MRVSQIHMYDFVRGHFVRDVNLSKVHTQERRPGKAPEMFKILGKGFLSN